MGSVNIIQLAKHLNMSKSTVSRAMKDSYDISEETKMRIRAAAKELNYQPNPYASSLRKHRSKTIAVVLPEVANNFFSTVINGIEKIAAEKGYHVLIYLTHDDPANEVSIFGLLKSGRVDGIIMSVTSEPEHLEHIEEMNKSGIPIIFFDRICENFETVKIATDDVASSFNAITHLVENGCKRIAFLSVLKSFSVGNKRLEGYLEGLRHYNLPIEESLIIRGDQDYENNHRLIKESLLSDSRPDGFLAPVEKMAITCYYACEELNIRIPQDIKIVSFSNLEIASLLNPSLTTITQPAFDMGKKAATLLMNSLEKKKFKLSNETIIIPSILVARRSTEMTY